MTKMKDSFFQGKVLFLCKDLRVEKWKKKQNTQQMQASFFTALSHNT